jgi:hypothetical protein
MKILGNIDMEKYVCKIVQDDDGRVHYTAGATIDADGANGQNGGAVAYRVDDAGSDALANAGMARQGARIVCKHDWARSVVILGADNEPRIFADGLIASMTWYRHPFRAADDPAAYVDAETVPYIVVPPMIVKRTVGVVRGCLSRVSYRGQHVECVVADLGPANKIGELSIAAARKLGIPSSPRHGGVEDPEVDYELWPGRAAPGFVLIPA